MLSLGGVGLGVLGMPKLLERTTPAAAAAAPVTTPFSVEMPIPGVLEPVSRSGGTDVYEMSIEPANVELLPGYQTPALTYGGQFVGPTIKARTGRKVRITYTNNLTDTTNVHLHGGHTPASSDGHPMDLINPGASRVYEYPNTQQGATLWYHDHSHHAEDQHIYRGLHGFYLLEDPSEQYLGLPGGDYDVPILLRDAKLDGNANLVFAYENPANRTTILANGKAQPYFQVAARKYRFRILNGANERIFKLSIPGAEIKQIASDGGLLPAPVTRTEFAIGSAERVEFVVDFGRHPVGTRLMLTDAATGPVLRFDVVAPALDASRLPAQLRPLPALPPATVYRELKLSFDFSGPAAVGLVNDKPFDANRIDYTVKRGTTEIWTIYNADTAVQLNHTFHLHLVQFRVLDVDGTPPPADDAGLKDTVLVEPGKRVRVQATFTDYLGRYMYHCHYNEHSTLGMMAQMEIVA